MTYCILGLLIKVFIVFLGQRTRPVRGTTGARMAAALAAEKLDEFGNPVQSRRHVAQPLRPGAIAKRKRVVDDAETDVDDNNFIASSTSEDGSDDGSDVMEISNEEVWNVLT